MKGLRNELGGLVGVGWGRITERNQDARNPAALFIKNGKVLPVSAGLVCLGGTLVLQCWMAGETACPTMQPANSRNSSLSKPVAIFSATGLRRRVNGYA